MLWAFPLVEIFVACEYWQEHVYPQHPSHSSDFLPGEAEMKPPEESSQLKRHESINFSLINQNRSEARAAPFPEGRPPCGRMEHGHV